MTENESRAKFKKPKKGKNKRSASTIVAQLSSTTSESETNEEYSSTQMPPEGSNTALRSIEDAKGPDLVRKYSRVGFQRSTPSFPENHRDSAEAASKTEYTESDELNLHQNSDSEPSISLLEKVDTYADATRASKAREIGKVMTENSLREGGSTLFDALKRSPKSCGKRNTSREYYSPERHDGSGEESEASSTQGLQVGLGDERKLWAFKTPTESVDCDSYTVTSSNLSSWDPGTADRGQQTIPEINYWLDGQGYQEQITQSEPYDKDFSGHSVLGLPEAGDTSITFARRLQLYETHEEAQIEALQDYLIHQDLSEQDVESMRNGILAIPHALLDTFSKRSNDVVTAGSNLDTIFQTEAQRHDADIHPSAKINDKLKKSKVRRNDLQKQANDLVLQTKSLKAKVGKQKRLLKENPNSQQPTNDRIQEIETQNRSQQNLSNDLKENLDITTEDLKSAIAAAGQIYDGQNECGKLLKELQGEVNLVCNVMDTVPTLEFEPLQEFRRQAAQAVTCDGENSLKLRRHLFKLLDYYENQREDYIDKIEHLEEVLVREDDEVSGQENSSQGNSSSGKMLAKKVERQYDRETFERLYQVKREKRRLFEQQLKQAQQQADAAADLEKRNKSLTNDLTQDQAKLTSLQEQLRDLRFKEQFWEGDFHKLREEQQTREAQLVQVIDNQKKEILFYVKEYHNKANNEKYWEFAGLQEEIRDLELELKSANEALEQTKRDRSKLENEIFRLQKTQNRKDKHIERLETALVMNGIEPAIALRPDPIEPSRDFSQPSPPDWLTRLSQLPDTPYIPRCHLPDGIAEREVKLKILKEQQRKRRNEEQLVAEYVEKLRMWKMGENYPPGKKGWREMAQQGMWRRWDGGAWVLSFGGREEQELVEGLKKKGLIK